MFTLGEISLQETVPKMSIEPNGLLGVWGYRKVYRRRPLTPMDFWGHRKGYTKPPLISMDFWNYRKVK